MTTPSPIALVVCDALYQDPSGKSALVGLFNRLVAARFPATHPQMCVFASVTEVRAGTRFRLVVEHAENGTRVAELSAGPPPETGVDPTAVLDLRFILQGLTFPEPGRYYIQFWANDHLLLQRPFDAVLLQPAGGNRS
jgi:hypothetical protein